MRKHFNKIIAGGAATVALSLSLAACGGSNSNNGGTGRGSASGTSGVVVQAGQGARLSGTYSALDLWSWLPQDMYPSDITEVTDGAYNTGSMVSVNAKYSASGSCSTVLGESGGPGWGEEAYFIDQGENSAKNAFYSYGAYEFPTASEAAAFVKSLAAKYASCGSFTATGSSGASIAATLSVGPASEARVPAADAAVDLRQKASANGANAVGDYIYAADGNVVVCVGVASSTGSLPTEVDQTEIAETVLTSLTTGQAAWVASGSPSDYTTSTAEPDTDGDQLRLYSTDAATWAEFNSERITVAWAGDLS